MGQAVGVLQIFFKLLVLGVLAILLVAAFVIYPQVQSSNRANMEAQNFSAMSAKISSLFATGSRFERLNNTLAMNARIFPDTMREGVTDPAEVKSVWGGSVTNEGVPAYNYTQYWVTYENVPSADCVKFANAIVGGVEALNVGGMQIKYGADATEGWAPGEIRPENIAAGCSSAQTVTIIAQNKR
jgi:hypothetical protein